MFREPPVRSVCLLDFRVIPAAEPENYSSTVVSVSESGLTLIPTALLSPTKHHSFMFTTTDFQQLLWAFHADTYGSRN